MGFNKASQDPIAATEYNNVLSNLGFYAASSAGNDTYAITVSPVPNDYDNGDHYAFKADVGNTGPATLNVNGNGAKTLKKLGGVDLEDGDIIAGQIVEVRYDGTYFQVISGLPPSGLSFTADQDVTAGMPLGVSFEVANTVAKAFAGYFDVATPATLGLQTAAAIALEGADDKFVLVYSDAATTLKAVVGTINRSTRAVTYGSAVTLSSTAVVTSNVCFQVMSLGTNKFCVAYINSADQTQGKIIGGTVSGSTITLGSAVTFYDHASANLLSVSGAKVTTDKVALAWEHNNADVFCGATSFSGTVATAGTAVALNSNVYNVGNGQFVISITTDKFVVWGGTYVQCGTISTLTITLGTQVDTSLSGGYSTSDMVSHDTDKFIVKGGQDAKVCTVATRTITVNAIQNNVGASTGLMRVVSPTDVRAYSTGATYSWAISGSTITATQTSRGFGNDAQHSLVRGGGILALNNSYWAFLNITSTTNLRVTIMGMALGFAGFAQSAVSRSASVIVNGNSDSNQSGLTPGVYYNFSTAVPGVLTLAAASALDTPRELAMYLALSATRIIKV